MRRSRSIGQEKTHLQHVGIAAAINVVRIVAWLDGQSPAPTRRSAYERLYYAAWKVYQQCQKRVNSTFRFYHSAKLREDYVWLFANMTFEF
jgi:hypothetical protein